MNYWRISKYNTHYRNKNREYLKEEWTSFSDIGKTYENEKLTFDQYLQIEDAYIAAITLFLESSDVSTMQVTDLEKLIAPTSDTFYSDEMVNIYTTTSDQMVISKELVTTIARLALRENLWCKLEAKNMYIHFGYDYYMYIGSSKPCDEVIKQIKNIGLSVESYQSPYE